MIMIRRLLLALAVIMAALPALASDYVISISVRVPQQHEGARLFVDELNRAGGIDGRKVRLKAFEDGFSMDRAMENAHTVAHDGETLAVIGHSGSAASIAAGKIYGQVGLPAVTPFSTNDAITKGNPLYFRTTFTDSVQGSVLAHYAREVLGATTVSIVADDGTYGAFLADEFARTAAKAGLKVARRITVEATGREEDPIQGQIRSVAASLSGLNPADIGLVFVAAGAKISASVVMELRDARVFNPLLLPDEGASAAFLAAISESPRRVVYARDLHISSPFIFDIGGRDAQNFRLKYLARTGREPSYQTAYAYDAMAVVVEAMRRAALHQTDDLAERRARLRDALAAIDTPAEAVQGITGPLYFDQDRNAAGRLFSVGELRNGAVVSSVAQLRELIGAEDVRDLGARLKRRELIAIGDHRYFHKTNVAYTGVHLRRVDSLDYHAGTFTAEADLWFRAHQEIDGARIMFGNAVGPVSIEESRRWKGDGGLVYQLFTVKGRFLMDTLAGTNLLKEHALGIQYSHRDLGASALLLIKDWMEDERQTLADYRANGLLGAERGWKVTEVSYFQDSLARNALGDTTRAGIVNQSIEHSRFNVVVHVEKDALSVAKILPGWWLVLALALVGTLAITLTVVSRRNPERARSLLQACYVADMVTLLLAREAVIEFHVQVPGLPLDNARMVLTAIGVAAWLVTAWYANRWVELSVWRIIERKDGHAVPKLMRRVAMALIFVGASFGVVSFVLDRDLTSLLATSGVVAMILGLALQPNLANIFSGIAINLEKPFHIGDWIEARIGRDVAVGQVVDMNWRTTKIMTPDGTSMSIPNGQLANVNITNLGESRTVKGALKVVLDGALEPGTVIERLRAAAAEVEGATEIKVEVVAIDRDSIEYTVKIAHDSGTSGVTMKVWRRIWETLARMEARQKEMV